MRSSATGWMSDCTAHLLHLGREIDELFVEQYDRLSFHHDETKNPYRRDAERLRPLVTADGISSEKRKECSRALLASCERYRAGFIASLLALDDKIGVRIAMFATLVDKFTDEPRDISEETVAIAQRWLALSRELHAARADGARAAATNVEVETFLPHKILLDDGRNDIPIDPEQWATFKQTFDESADRYKWSYEVSQRISAERQRLSTLLFVEPPSDPSAPSPTPQLPPISEINPLEGKAWFRLLKILYAFLWCFAIALCAFLAYAGTSGATILWIGVVCSGLLIGASKIFFYVTLGRTTSIESPGSGFVDIDWLENRFTEYRSNSPEVFHAVIEPHLSAWKVRYGRRIPVQALREIQRCIDNQVSAIRQERNEVVVRAAKAGVAIQIARLREMTESTIAQFHGPDRVHVARHLYARLFVLEATYGAIVPVDEVDRIVDEWEKGIQGEPSA